MDKNLDFEQKRKIMLQEINDIVYKEMSNLNEKISKNLEQIERVDKLGNINEENEFLALYNDIKIEMQKIANSDIALEKNGTENFGTAIEKEQIEEVQKPEAQNNEKLQKSEAKVSRKVDAFFDNNKLIISEKSGKVYLPYKKEQISQILEKNNNYKNEQEVIEDKFIVPIKKYRFPVSARFREAYDLIKNKEKGGIIEAFSLGMELSKWSNLHPAVITACKNLDELDIYLSYLETNEADKFDIFDVVFEIPPI